ncbi:hypothetical protein ['Camptotheca acuminata' phytoplasma]|uniref:hypothetical protein n=1 Tax='Camptotheca acuminata' phytoplasma TaxID=3239192 RepID=UPI00351A721C
MNQPMYLNNNKDNNNPFALGVVQIISLIILFIFILGTGFNWTITIMPLLIVYFFMTLYNGGYIFNLNKSKIMFKLQEQQQLENELKNLKSQKEKLEIMSEIKKNKSK